MNKYKKEINKKKVEMLDDNYITCKTNNIMNVINKEGSKEKNKRRNKRLIYAVSLASCLLIFTFSFYLLNKVNSLQNSEACCAVNYNIPSDAVKFTDNVFIGKIGKVVDYKKYNILNDNQTPVDKIFYEVYPIHNLKGDMGNKEIILRNVDTEVFGIEVSALCEQGTTLKEGSVYLFLSRYTSEEDAEKSTDKRSKGNTYYTPFGIELHGYDETKDISSQSKIIQNIIKRYTDVIN